MARSLSIAANARLHRIGSPDSQGKTSKAGTARLHPAGVRLAALRAAGVGKPLLAPHGESHSQDLLLAASTLEEFWPRRRRATVAPVFAWQ